MLLKTNLAKMGPTPFKFIVLCHFIVSNLIKFFHMSHFPEQEHENIEHFRKYFFPHGLLIVCWFRKYHFSIENIYLNGSQGNIIPITPKKDEKLKVHEKIKVLKIERIGWYPNFHVLILKGLLFSEIDNISAVKRPGRFRNSQN